jgi:hypothetical protein
MQRRAAVRNADVQPLQTVACWHVAEQLVGKRVSGAYSK